MNRLLITTIAVTLLTLTGCTIRIPTKPNVSGSGVSKSETREIGDFHGVKVSVGMNVRVTCDQDPALKITGDDNIIPLIITEVKNGVLEIRSDENLDPVAESLIEIQVKSVDQLMIEGSGDIEVAGMKCEAGKIVIAGAGSVTGDVDAASLSLSVAGSGDIALKGRSPQLDLSISGSGNGMLEELIADDVSISIAGSGDVAVHADKSLKVSVSGSGDVVWSGSAGDVKSTIMGSGAVTKKE
ncbi:MAG: DUF2807 domain-containing protein [Planctomyces sp.]|nr:DUF2807 domain-containing protein [Planctomyces sp.]